LLIEHISISRSGLFHECQQKYKYRYHLKVISDKPEAPWFVYGKFIHRVAELYVIDKGATDIFSIATNIINENIEFEDIEKFKKLDSHYKNKIKTHLINVEKISKKLGFEGEVEHEVKLDLDEPNQKFLLGYIDRLFFKDNKAFILDYKTTKIGIYRKTKETIKKDLQLRAYAYYVHKKFNVPPEDIHTALYYLDDSKFISAKYNLQEIYEAKDELKKDYITIMNLHENSVHGNVGSHCKRCDYENVCPFYASQRAYL